MQANGIINLIKKKFDEVGSPTRVPLLRGKGTFKAEFSTDGVYVDNLGNQSFLKWEAFTEAVSLLKEKGGEAKKGNAMNSRLADRGLPLDSVEGYIAHKVYGYKEGDSVFPRVIPIACILIWVNICQHKTGILKLSGCKYSKCPHEKLPGSEYCIFHLKDDNKNIEDFNNGINKILEIDDEIIKFNRFYFPPGTSDFSNKQFHKDIHFDEVEFSGDAIFEGAKFSGDAIFKGAKFSGDAIFYRAKFSRFTDFRDVNFSGFTDFDIVIFFGNVYFMEAKFKKITIFLEAEFIKNADFDGAKFFRYAEFTEVKFKGITSFSKVTFSEGVDFISAKFSEITNFGANFNKASFFKVKFLKEVGFHKAKFTGEVFFNSVIFSKKADLNNTQFSKNTEFIGVFFKDVSFEGAKFSGNTYFISAEFLGVANFIDVKFLENLDFQQAAFSEIVDFRHAKFFKDVKFLETTFSFYADFYFSSFYGKTDIMPNESKIFNFSNTYFSENVRIKANLSKCHLKGSNIERADLTDSTWNQENNNNNLSDNHFSVKSFISSCISRLVSVYRFLFCSSITILEENMDPNNKMLQGINLKTLEGIYRRLKQSYQKSGDYETAGKFYFQEMECKRKQLGFFSNFFWNIFYRGFCGYGEKPYNVVLISILTIFFYATLYFYSGIEINGTDLINYDISLNSFDFSWIGDFWWCLYTSIITFTTLGYGDVHPVGWSRVFASIESLIGIFMTALFIFVFTRKMLR